ncbi:outer membrane protein assembly factor BamA [Candidatus Pelagibacter sp. Uisw_099_02]|uniref:outer membrane protein assembly factor BamA n=1 Tax=Candidatus Pelagibacter sp. Uisw_099_02 TaxID=3230981 RepID=UPI0023737F81|nr:outer membrane protein assembly factor BamA [Candidatus Pelagibacter sp.]
MFSTFLKFLIVMLISISSAFGEVVKSIKVSGNERISNETIIVFSKIKIGQNLSESQLNKVIIDLYETDFFKDVSINFDNQILNISVDENPIIQNLYIEGIKNKTLIVKIREILSLKNRSSYKEILAKRDVNIILNSLRSIGHYFSDVQYIVNYNENNTVDLTYDVKLGDKASISEIRFIGEKFFKDRKLRSVITSEENRFWKFFSNKKYVDQKRISLDQRLLKNFYLNKGFYNVKVSDSYANMLDTNKFELTFNINSGRKYYFNELDLLLPENYSRDNFSEILNLFADLKNQIYSLNKIEDILDEIDNIALNSQFEFISATVNEEIIDTNKLDFIFEIKETQKKYVNRVNVYGNTITREEVIRNSLIVDEGDPFNELLHNKSINTLKAKNIFKTVESEIVDSEKDGYTDINLTFEEKPTGEISVGAGYGTRGAAFGFTIKENNFLGKGVKLVTDISYTTDSLSAGLSYTEPNFAYSNRSLTSSFSSSSVDKITNYGYETKTNTLEFSTFFEQYRNLYVSPAISVRHENLTTNSNASEQYKKQKGKFYDITMPYGISYDKRDNQYDPKAGFISSFTQELPLISNNPAITNSYNFSKYFSIGDNFVNNIDVYFKAINSISNKDVRVSKRILLPGNRLRGFEVGKIGPIDNDNFVGGNYAASMNFVTQVPNLFPELQNADFNFFLDMANVWGVDYSSALDDSGSIRSALGVGVDWFTPIGPLSFSLSQPITSSNSDKKETFRFNLGTTF